jgi:hypothetical protein
MMTAVALTVGLGACGTAWGQTFPGPGAKDDLIKWKESFPMQGKETAAGSKKWWIDGHAVYTEKGKTEKWIFDTDRNVIMWVNGTKKTATGYVIDDQATPQHFRGKPDEDYSCDSKLTCNADGTEVGTPGTGFAAGHWFVVMVVPLKKGDEKVWATTGSKIIEVAK